MWTEVIQLITTHHRFLVSSHEHPDGDALGSALAFGMLLEELGKEALLVMDDAPPRIYRFLDPDGRIHQYSAERDDRLIAVCDAAFILDVGALDRVGKVGRILRKHAVPEACIDHHATNDGFADLNVIDPHAASTSSLILSLLREMGREPSPRMAEALFAGLATDTGWFRFPNTSPQAFHDAAALIQAGASTARIYSEVYENLTAARMRLLGLVMGDFHQEADGRIVYFVVTREMMARTGADQSEVEGFVDNFRKIGGVEVVIFFREQAEGGTRLSLRAKHAADVGALAASFGGGGHRAAAGATLDEPLDEAIPKVLAAARKLVDSL